MILFSSNIFKSRRKKTMIMRANLQRMGVVGESREDLDSGRIWTVGLPYEWLMSLQKRHLKGFSFNKSFLSTIFVEVLFHC